MLNYKSRLSQRLTKADVVKLVYTHVSGTCAVRLVGSCPTVGTFFKAGDGGNAQGKQGGAQPLG